MTTAAEWLERFSADLGVEPPTPAEIAALLSVASEAAHASERVAAPISCWLVARSGHSVEDAVQIAAALALEMGAGGD